MSAIEKFRVRDAVVEVVSETSMSRKSLSQVKREVLGASRRPPFKIRKDPLGPSGVVGAVPFVGPG